MGERILPCPYCGRKFADEDARYAHAKAKHVGKKLKAIKTARMIERDRLARERAPRDDDESMASRMITAQLQQAMGGPVDEDWLLDCL